MQPETISEEEMMQMVLVRVADAGSQKAFAEQAKISESYLSDVLRDRRGIGDRIAEALGFERVVTYRRKVNR